MKRYSKLSILIGLGLLILLTGCSPQVYKQSRSLSEKGQHDEAIALMKTAVEENPQDFRNWQELGIAFYHKGDYKNAEDALRRGSEIKSDARTDLYLGLIFEKREMYGRAIDAYRRALAQKPGGKVGDKINERLDQLIMKKLDYEVSLALDSENSLSTDTIPENTVGVVDFDVSHLDPSLAPLAKGLAEFTAIDLAKVKSLRVVDRLKIEMILNELKLSSSQFADRSSGPRIGKLVGSAHLVTGSMLGLGEDQMRLDGAIVQTKDSTTETAEPADGELENIFKIQKQFVFNLLDKMGIELTPAERDSIRKSPTESYLAFLAYSKGLDLRSQGMYREATEQFNNAYRLDQGFQQASKNARQSQAIANPSASAESFESVVAGQVGTAVGDAQLGSFQTASIASTGFIETINNFGNLGSPEIPPRPSPEDNSVTIYIRGIFDAPLR